MKLLALELRAFGPFTGTNLDFSDGTDGLHIVYGPNEAGKSSALRGLKALFFGIHERTTDNFLHDNSKLRVGGRIQHSDGSSIFVIRRKGRINTLLREDENVMDEAILKPYLSGVGEQMFSRMFGINYTDLVEGGRDIIAGGGDVGESLFAAGMGGVGLKEILIGLDKEADDLFTVRGKKFINLRIAELHDLKKEIQSTALSGRQWEEHVEALKEAQTEKDKLLNGIGVFRSEINRLTRLQKAIPIIAEWKELHAQRTDMGEVLILPEGFSEDRRRALQTLKDARATETKVRERLAKLKESLDAISFSPEILKYGQVIEEYHIRLGAHVKALADLPKLNGELSQLQASAETLLKEIDSKLTLEDVESLRISSLKRQNIRELGTNYHSLMEALKNARRSSDALSAKIAHTQGKLPELGEVKDVRELRELVQRINKQGDLEAELKKTKAELKVEEDQASVDLNKLPLWNKPLEILETLPMPSSETIDRFEQELDLLIGSIEKEESHIQEALSNISELDSKLESLELSGAVPTEIDLDEARGRREHGWKLIRSAWLEGKLDPEESKSYASEEPIDKAYERSVYHADDISDRLRHEAGLVAQKSTWIAEIDRLKDDIAAHEAVKNNLAADLALKQAEWGGLWKNMGIEPLSPKEMRAWMLKQEALARRAEQIRNLRINTSQIDTRIEEYKNTLVKCMALLGEPETDSNLTLLSLTDKAQVLIDRTETEKNQLANLNESLDYLRSQLDDEQNEEKAASNGLSEWKSAWREAVKEIGLDETATPSAANFILEKNQELFGKFDELIKLRRRIDGIHRDKKEYADEIKSFASRIDPKIVELPFNQIAVELHAKYTKALEDAATHGQLRERYEKEEQELEEACNLIRESTEMLNSLCLLAKCSRVEELEEMERRSSLAQELDKSVAGLKKQLLAFSSGGTFQELVDEAEKINPDSLPSLIIEKEERGRELEDSLSILAERIGSEKTELSKMDGSSKTADMAERAQAVIAQIHNAAERHIRLRAASAILRTEIDRYRTKNQGPILKRASEIFSVLTLNSFAGLKISYGDDDKPFLVGLRPNGEEIMPGGMSDGTSDQLYLSLRLASLEKYLSANEPLPFIVDDILVNFDDNRSGAVLKILAELSGKTQVILFTHHNHLIEIARSTMPGNVLHIHLL